MVEPDVEPDPVGALFHIVVVTTCPDDPEDRVVLLNGGWLETVDPGVDPEAVAPLLQIVVVTNCPDDNGYEVVLVNSGWLEMVDPEADPDLVKPLLQTVVVTTCPDDKEYEVVLVNGGWLFVSVLVILPLELTVRDSVVVETAELPEVATPPVGVTVITTTVPAGLEAAVELAEPEPEMVEVMVLTPVCSVAVVFQGS